MNELLLLGIFWYIINVFEETGKEGERWRQTVEGRREESSISRFLRFDPDRQSRPILGWKEVLLENWIDCYSD